MIVVDTNVIAALYLRTEVTAYAERLLLAEPFWAAPTLWRSEFRHLLALYLRKALLSVDEAIRIQQEAESLLQENEYMSHSPDVLALVADSSCSAYDCEFVALAQGLELKLATTDKKILKTFPDTAIHLRDAVPSANSGT